MKDKKEKCVPKVFMKSSRTQNKENKREKKRENLEAGTSGVWTSGMLAHTGLLSLGTIPVIPFFFFQK